MRAIRILPIALTVLVAACATQTAYVPADERGDADTIPGPIAVAAC